MKKTKINFALILTFSINVSLYAAQIKNQKIDTVDISGNCEMCKNTIEKSGSRKKVSSVSWNVETKKAILSYDSKKTTQDAILKKIALAGYDNDKYLAPDEVYAKLHGCCKYDRKKKGFQPKVNNSVTNLALQSTNQLTIVFNNYFDLKDALVATNGNLASEKAAELLKSINEVKMEKLSNEEHLSWMKLMKDLSFDAGHIAETKDVSHQRSHFILLSKNVYELSKVSKQGVTVYYQFCPMANDGKGANWLSKESVIKNPYYGSQMLTCGKTIETIK